MARAKLLAYLLNYRGNINLFFKLLDKLKAKILAWCIVDKPKHAHAVIMLSQKLDKKLSSELAKHGCYINWRFLRNSLDVDKAINYVVNNPSLHKSSGEVYSVRFISSNGHVDMRGDKMADSLEDRLSRLESVVEKLAETVERLANGVAEKQSTAKQSNQAQQAESKITLKQGKYGYMLFLNNYKMVRGKPMVLLSGRDLTALKAEIDMLLSKKTKRSKISKKEGFEKAIR